MDACAVTCDVWRRRGGAILVWVGARGEIAIGGAASADTIARRLCRIEFVPAARVALAPGPGRPRSEEAGCTWKDACVLRVCSLWVSPEEY